RAGRQGIGQWREWSRSWLGGSSALRPAGAGFGCAGNGSYQVIGPILCSSSQEFFILMETHEQVIHWSPSLGCFASLPSGRRPFDHRRSRPWGLFRRKQSRRDVRHVHPARTQKPASAHRTSHRKSSNSATPPAHIGTSVLGLIHTDRRLCAPVDG